MQSAKVREHVILVTGRLIITTHSPLYIITSSYRWVRSAGKKLPILARLVVLMYQTHMGHVDRLDKNVALSRIRLKRCIKRYHRAIFIWYIAAMLNNIIVLFDLLFPSAKTLRKTKARIGYKHWFQNALGNGLIDHGISVCKDNLVAAANAAASGQDCSSSSSSSDDDDTVLCDHNNAPAAAAQQPRGRGRPSKRKRGPGRTATVIRVSVTRLTLSSSPSQTT